jgi:glyoxylase-like metal-dependent hydrolase (beta-lactamase superfamily II)
MEGVHLLDVSSPFPVGKTNIYFIEGPTPTLIDAPPKGAVYVDELRAALNRIGYGIGDIARIIITHPHFDHFGSVADIVAEGGAEVWASVGAAGHLEHFDEESRKDYDHYSGILAGAGAPGDVRDYVATLSGWAGMYGCSVPVSRLLDDGDAIDLGPGPCRIAAVPGHSPWCILIYREDRTYAFSGDFLLREITPNALIQRPDATSPDYRSLGAYLASLRKAKSLGLDMALPGHGEAITDVAGRIDEIVSFIGARSATVRRILHRGPRTPFSLVEEIFPGLPREQLFLGLSEVIGHLELLESKGLARLHEGLWRSSPHFPCDTKGT